MFDDSDWIDPWQLHTPLEAPSPRSVSRVSLHHDVRAPVDRTDSAPKPLGLRGCHSDEPVVAPVGQSAGCAVPAGQHGGPGRGRHRGHRRRGSSVLGRRRRGRAGGYETDAVLVAHVPCVSVGSGRLRQQHGAAPDPANPALPLCVPERTTGGRIAPPLPYPTCPSALAPASAPMK